QVLVEVLAARGLRGTDLQGYANPYCIIYLKATARRRRRQRPRGATYFCEKTVCPKWVDQRLVFTVPAAAARSQRGYSLRVMILSRDFLRPNDLLGQAAVPLDLLLDQREHVGWFPLNQRASRLMALSQMDKPGGCGSVQLRLQWVHTKTALL
ncbi:C2 domain-containing protein, partial [Tribonema minus]